MTKEERILNGLKEYIASVQAREWSDPDSTQIQFYLKAFADMKDMIGFLERLYKDE